MANLDPSLSPLAWELLTATRRATLTTLDARDRRPRSVPICFVLVETTIYSALDDKPKSIQDPRLLRRVRNLEVDPRATILVDRWDEDWERLAFVEVACRGLLLPPDSDEHRTAVDALRAKYPQYRAHRLEERPLLRFAILSTTDWRAAAPRA